MIIGIDIDDTIADTYETLFNYAQNYTLNELKREPTIKEVSCDTHMYVETLHGWNTEESEKFWELYYEKMLKNVNLKTCTLEYLQKLKDEGNKIIFITARFQPTTFELNVEKITKQWLEKNDIPYDKLIVNASDKQKVAIDEKIDVFIDDSFRNCQAVSDSGIKTYIIDTRLNRDLKRENIERVYSWPHVYMKLKNK